jgi:hypothetical protein
MSIYILFKTIQYVYSYLPGLESHMTINAASAAYVGTGLQLSCRQE